MQHMYADQRCPVDYASRGHSLSAKVFSTSQRFLWKVRPKLGADATAAVPRVLNCEREHWRLFRMTKEDPDGSWIQVPAGIPVGHFIDFHSFCMLSDHCRGLILLKITSGETRDKNIQELYHILMNPVRKCSGDKKKSKKKPKDVQQKVTQERTPTPVWLRYILYIAIS